MSDRQIKPALLTYDTFVSVPIPVATDDLVPNGDRRMFSPMTATLIAGAENAVLVDPPMTIELRSAEITRRLAQRLPHRTPSGRPSAGSARRICFVRRAPLTSGHEGE